MRSRPSWQASSRHPATITDTDTDTENSIIIYTETGTAAINVTVAGNALPLSTIQNFMIRSDTKKQQVRQGLLHMTDNQLVVDVLDGAVAQAVFTPDMGLGQIRTIINRP